MDEHDAYLLPEALARHARGARFAPDELRGVCRSAGERLGREDAGGGLISLGGGDGPDVVRTRFPRLGGALRPAD